MCFPRVVDAKYFFVFRHPRRARAYVYIMIMSRRVICHDDPSKRINYIIAYTRLSPAAAAADPIGRAALLIVVI